MSEAVWPLDRQARRKVLNTMSELAQLAYLKAPTPTIAPPDPLLAKIEGVLGSLCLPTTKVEGRQLDFGLLAPRVPPLRSTPNEIHCRMLKHPENKISIANMVMIAGLKLTKFKNQMIAICWMLFHKRGDCEGGWLADEMRLGKVRTVFSLRPSLSDLIIDDRRGSELECLPRRPPG
jgi:hypothetical protein